MLYQYDKGFVAKMKNVLPPNQVIYAPVERFYERYLMTNNNGQIVLPAVSIWRTGYSFKAADARHWLGTSNGTFDYRIDSRGLPIATTFQSMPIDINYSLDIWAGTDIDRDDLMTELLYFLTVYPNVTINYRGKDFIFPLTIGEPEDLTDVTQFEEGGGDLYRASIPLTLSEARFLFSETIRLARFIKIDLDVSGTGSQFDETDGIIIGPHGREIDKTSGHDGC